MKYRVKIPIMANDERIPEGAILDDTAKALYGSGEKDEAGKVRHPKAPLDFKVLLANGSIEADAALEAAMAKKVEKDEKTSS